MKNQEIKDTGLLIRNEQQIGGNTALRVGGVIEGIGYALDNKDAANGYYQATINVGSISVNAPNFVLGTGGNLRIKMPAAGTTASTLTIGNANAVQLWYNGAAVSSDNTWEQGEIISVFYDGTRFMASNSQGGGGNAEKIKYDNSQSGLAADNVKEALDNSANKINEITAYGELALPALANGIFSFNDTNCIWVNVNDNNVRKHCCYQRKASDRFLEVTANSNAVAKVVFLTTYNVVNQANMTPYLCAWPINIEAGSTHRFIIPDNCVYIVFNIQYKTTIYTPASVKIGENFSEIIGGKLTNIDIQPSSSQQTSILLGNGTIKTANNWSVTTFPVQGGDYVCVSGRSSGWVTKRADSYALCACYDGNGVFITSYEVGKSTNYDETEGNGYIIKLPDNAAIIKVSAPTVLGGYPKARVSNLGVVPKIEAMETELNIAIDNSMYMGGVEPTQVGYIITNNGAVGSVCDLTPTAATNWEYVLTSCKEGDVFKVKGYGGIGGRLWAFLDKDNKILSQETSYDDVLEREITAPSGAVKVLSDYNTTFEHYFIRATDVERSYEDKMTISQYGLESKLIQQTFLSPSYSDPLKTQGLLTLLHFSDLHSDADALRKIVGVKERYSPYIHDAIFTGDSVFNYYNDPMPFDSVDGAGSILNTAGNHDAWTSGTTDYLRTEAQVYATIMANHIDNWDVEYEANKPYYYKDYTTQGFRLIVIDSVHWHGYIPQGNSGDSTRAANAANEDASVQKAWFEATLSSAKTANLAVVCAIHYPPITGIQFLKKTGFCTYFTEDSKIVGDGWYSRDEIFDCVDTFISGGGKFMCWLMGHTHYDIAGTIVGHPNQFVALIERAGVKKASPYNNHIYGTFTEYAANIITFDKVNSLVKITRVGNTVDKFMQSKETLCYDVANMKMIYNT